MTNKDNEGGRVAGDLKLAPGLNPVTGEMLRQMEPSEMDAAVAGLVRSARDARNLRLRAISLEDQLAAVRDRANLYERQRDAMEHGKARLLSEKEMLQREIQSVLLDMARSQQASGEVLELRRALGSALDLLGQFSGGSDPRVLELRSLARSLEVPVPVPEQDRALRPARNLPVASGQVVQFPMRPHAPPTPDKED